jgi:two-component system OmpR family sensor kinase
MTLRVRLLLGMAVVAVVLVLASLSINRATEHNLVEQVDHQLERSVQQTRTGRGLGRYPGSSEGPSGAPSPLYVAAVDPQSGRLAVINVPDDGTDDPAVPSITAAQVTAHLGGEPFTVEGEGGGRFRALVRTEGRDRRTVLFAQSLQDVDESIDRLLTIQAIAAAAILTTLGLVTFWVLRLGVRPVVRMTGVATAIGEGDLSQRIPDTVPGTEAGDLGDALNHMLGRIEYAFDERARSEARLRQFVGDASHELRTPVTTIRGYAELYRLGGLASEHDLNEAMRRTEQEATRMGDLVGDLLDLASLDQGRPLNLAPVDLSVLAADAVADARAVEPARPIELVAPEPATVVGDEPLLRQIVGNLVANARVHTAADVPIRVLVRDERSAVVLEVADQGPGMDADVAAHAFERFYRADPARTRSQGGSGLGLAIVASTVAAHGGTVALDTAHGRGTTVRVTLPRPTP